MQREHTKRLDRLEALLEESTRQPTRQPTWQPMPAQVEGCLASWVKEGVIAPTAPDGSPWTSVADALGAALLTDPPWLEAFVQRQSVYLPPGYYEPGGGRLTHLMHAMFKLSCHDRLPHGRMHQDGESWEEYSRRFDNAIYDIFFQAVIFPQDVLQQIWTRLLSQMPSVSAKAIPEVAAAMARAGVPPTWVDAQRWLEAQEGA